MNVRIVMKVDYLRRQGQETIPKHEFLCFLFSLSVHEYIGRTTTFERHVKYFIGSAMLFSRRFCSSSVKCFFNYCCRRNAFTLVNEDCRTIKKNVFISPSHKLREKY